VEYHDASQGIVGETQAKLEAVPLIEADRIEWKRLPSQGLRGGAWGCQDGAQSELLSLQGQRLWDKGKIAFGREHGALARHGAGTLECEPP